MHGVPWPFDFCMHMHETCMFNVMRGCRTKPKIDQTKSDKEIFNGLPMGDTWDDANMADVFFYIYIYIDLQPLMCLTLGMPQCVNLHMIYKDLWGLIMHL